MFFSCKILNTYITPKIGMWAFNNYVDQMRGRGGQKLYVFVKAQGIKTVHAGWVGQKMAKFCPRSCRMTPNVL